MILSGLMDNGSAIMLLNLLSGSTVQWGVGRSLLCGNTYYITKRLEIKMHDLWWGNAILASRAIPWVCV